jgi:hypothetical protein
MRVSRLLAVAAVAGSFSVLGCGGATASVPVGMISVQVLDANGAGVQLVNVDLYKVFNGGSLLWRAGSTSSNGIAVFGQTGGGLQAGDYFVHVSFVTNNQLAAGETNDKPVTVSGGDNVLVTFHVESSGSSPR